MERKEDQQELGQSIFEPAKELPNLPKEEEEIPKPKHHQKKRILEPKYQSEKKPVKKGHGGLYYLGVKK